MAPTGREPSLEDEGIPEIEEPINDDEGIIPPGDTPIAVDEFGVTAVEERQDEPIAERILREVPDELPGDLDDRAVRGRLVQPGDEDVDTIDDEKDVVATLVGEDDEGLSAEEAALHITDQP